MILNAFWEPSSDYIPPRFGIEGIRNYQELHMAYPSKVNENLCRKITSTHENLSKLENHIQSCAGNELDQLLSSDNTCFDGFYKQYDQVIIDIANVAENTSEQYLNNWAKTLLALVYNNKYVEAFGIRTEDAHKIRVKNLITFMYTTKNVLSENQHVECGRFRLNNRSNTIERELAWDDGIKVEDVPNRTKLMTVFKHEMDFRVFPLFAKRLLNQFPIDVTFQLYWDGTETTLDKVYAKFEMYTFDIEDAYDYASFFVKWVMTVVYSRLIGVCKSRAEVEGGSSNQNQSEMVKDDMTKFLDVDFVKSLPVVHILLTSVFQTAINLYQDGLTLGFVENSLIEKGVTLSDHCNKLSSEIDQLRKVLNTDNLPKTSEVLIT